MKYFVCLTDDKNVYKGTTNLETDKDFFKKYTELSKLYSEFRDYSYGYETKIQDIIKLYDSPLDSITESLTPNDLRIIYVGFKVLDSLVNEGCLLSFIETEFNGLEEMEEFWILDDLEGMKVQTKGNIDNKYKKIMTIQDEQYEIESENWV